MEIRKLKVEEIDLLLDLIKEMARYEKLENEVKATHESLYDSVFVSQVAKAALLYEEDKVLGYLLYFYNFSSFTGCPNLYIEDIFVKEEYRRHGFGKACFKFLAEEAVKNGCKRIDWVCLDWNKKGLDFYQRMKAKRLDMWVLHRLEEDEIKELAGE